MNAAGINLRERETEELCLLHEVYQRAYATYEAMLNLPATDVGECRDVITAESDRCSEAMMAIVNELRRRPTQPRTQHLQILVDAVEQDLSPERIARIRVVIADHFRDEAAAMTRRTLDGIDAGTAIPGAARPSRSVAAIVHRGAVLRRRTA